MSSRLLDSRAWAVSLLFAFIGTVGAAAPPSGKGPFVLVTIDTLRADHVGIYGYRRAVTPTLDRLGRNGIVFTHAYAQVPMTVPSHASVLSGTYPTFNGVHDFSGQMLPADIPTLAEIFQRSGFRTAGFVSAYVVSSVWGFNRGFDTFDDRLSRRALATTVPSAVERRAGVTIDAAIHWLAAQPDPHFFVWIHLFDPHSPYDPPPPWRERFAGHLYEGEISYADAQLGRFFSALSARRWFDNATILVTADHGESLGEHGESEHGFLLYDATLHVPLILKPPAGIPVARHTVEAAVPLVDVGPSLTGLAGIPTQPQFQGHTLLRFISGASANASVPIYSETVYPRTSFGWHEEKSWREGQWKLIAGGATRLFNIKVDPHELHDLSSTDTASAHQLQSHLQAFIARFSSQHGREPAVSTANLDPLRSLGYVSASTDNAREDSSSLPDAERMLPVYNEFLADADLTRIDRRRAASALGRFVRTHPEIAAGWFEAGENALALGDAANAESDLIEAVRRQPQFRAAYLALARAAASNHDYARAQQAVDSLLTLSPQDASAYEVQGELQLALGRQGPAETAFRHALALGDPFGVERRELGRLLVEQRRYNEAADLLGAALKIDADDPVAQNFYGVCLAHLNRSADAIAAYRRAIQLQPRYGAAHLNLAFEYRRRGETANARREEARVCEVDELLCQRYVRQLADKPDTAHP